MDKDLDFFRENWYTRLCRHASGVMIRDHEAKRKEWELKQKTEFEKAQAILDKERKTFEEMKKITKKGDDRFISTKYKYSLAVNEFEKKKKTFEKNPMVEGLKFARMDLQPYQIESFGLYTLLMTFLSMIVFNIIILLLGRIIGLGVQGE